MDQSFPENFEDIANSMGIALYQRFSIADASLFLRCTQTDVKTLIKSKQLNAIKITPSNFHFFGYQLLEYLLGQVTDTQPAKISNKPDVDRIIRAKEVQDLTGLSRTTRWRFENKGEFPRRVSLGAISVGWKFK